MLKRIRYLFLIGIMLVGCKTDTKEIQEVLPNQETVQEEIITDTGFVTISDNHFVKGGNPYYYMGTNYWYGGHLGAGSGADKQRLRNELDQMQAVGITNLRVLGSSEGPNSEPWRVVPSFLEAPNTMNEAALSGLDYLLDEMKKRDMTAVVVLNNFWPWSGGMAQYVSWSQGDAIPYPPPAEGGDWWNYQVYTSQFYSDQKAMDMSNAYMAMIINRVNTVSGIAYKEDPTIMSWELCNEPRAIDNKKDYITWIQKSGEMIHELDPNHLVTTGSEGTISNEALALTEHELQVIDYMTCHIWVENWGWYNPKQGEKTYTSALDQAKDYLQKQLNIAKKINKPLVLEEFGMARDLGSYDATSSTQMRDQYYTDMFQTVYDTALAKGNLVGVNFWAFAGSGRASVLGGLWQPGDPYIGDPPHEIQGWYSVYDTDQTTLEIIKKYSDLMAAIK